MFKGLATIVGFLSAVIMCYYPATSLAVDVGAKVYGDIVLKKDTGDNHTGIMFSNGDVMRAAPKDGTIIHNGSGPPSVSLIGNIGDYYIDNTNHMLYGPYNGSWGTGVSLVGPTGPGLEAEAVILFASCPVGWTAYSPQPTGISPLFACFQSAPPGGGGCGSYPPTVQAYPPTESMVGTPVTISVVVTDPDLSPPCFLNQAITIRSEFFNLPPMSTAILTPAVGSYPTFVPDVPGSYGIRVRASDDTGRSSFVNVTIAVGTPPL